MPEQTDAFGIGVFTLADRLRLFSYATSPQRTDYLSVLRAVERARGNYVVLLHTSDVSANPAELGTWIEDVTPLLQQLYSRQVLDRSYGGARAARYCAGVQRWAGVVARSFHHSDAALAPVDSGRQLRQPDPGVHVRGGQSRSVHLRASSGVPPVQAAPHAVRTHQRRSASTGSIRDALHAG
ncbi:DUF2397 family protein [Streptomyces sp. 900105755]